MTKTNDPFSAAGEAAQKAPETDMKLGGEFGRHKGLLEVLATSDGAERTDAPMKEGYGG